MKGVAHDKPYWEKKKNHKERKTEKIIMISILKYLRKEKVKNAQKCFIYIEIKLHFSWSITFA